MSSIIDTKDYFNEDSLFRELPESAQQEIGLRLMPMSWKRVADELGFSVIEIDKFNAERTSQPAHQMLREWSRRNGSTLRVLVKTLENIGRSDVVSLLDDVRKRKLKHQAKFHS